MCISAYTVHNVSLEHCDVTLYLIILRNLKTNIYISYICKSMHWCEPKLSEFVSHWPPSFWKKHLMLNNSLFLINLPFSVLNASSFECQAFAPGFISSGHSWGYGNCWTLWCEVLSLLCTREMHLLKSSHPPPSLTVFLSSKTNKQSPFPPSHQSTGSFLCASRSINPPSGLPDCFGSRRSNQSWTLEMPAQRWKISSV